MNYVIKKKDINSINFFHSNFESKETVEYYIEQLNYIYNIIKESNLPFETTGVDFYLFYTLEDSLNTLCKEVPASVFMVPYCTNKHTIIIGHSPTLEQRNKDTKRIRRHLIHEFVHIMNWRLTSSKKILGDNNINIKIPSWCDEGLAEIIALKLSDNPSKINDIKKRVTYNKYDDINLKLINQYFNNFDNQKRSEAFDLSTVAVDYLFKKYNYDYLIQISPKTNAIEPEVENYLNNKMS